MKAVEKLYLKYNTYARRCNFNGNSIHHYPLNLTYFRQNQIVINRKFILKCHIFYKHIEVVILLNLNVQSLLEKYVLC